LIFVGEVAAQVVPLVRVGNAAPGQPLGGVFRQQRRPPAPLDDIQMSLSEIESAASQV